MKILTVAFCCCALMLAFAGCASKTDSESPEVGSRAPSFALPNVVSADQLDMASLKGQPVVLNFWSTSCSVCLQELEDLNKIHASGQAQVVGIALDDDPDRVAEVLSKRGIGYSVVLGDQKLFERYDGYSIPYTLVLDGSQVIRKKYFGRVSEEDLANILSQLNEQAAEKTTVAITSPDAESKVR